MRNDEPLYPAAKALAAARLRSNGCRPYTQLTAERQDQLMRAEIAPLRAVIPLILESIVPAERADLDAAAAALHGDGWETMDSDQRKAGGKQLIPVLAAYLLAPVTNGYLDFDDDAPTAGERRCRKCSIGG